ncbi:MAG: TatD family hydrolase [Muribaculaceae bacterium]|nr:TatD family hydrolase [Muribaculaceae bacterium]
MILDIHTHNPKPDPEAIIDISLLVRDMAEVALPSGYAGNQLFSVGIHPWWLTEDIPDSLFKKVEEAAALPQVAIIGEAGLDIPKGGPLFRQMIVFKRMVEISEAFAKPLLIHDVKAHDILLGLHKEMRPKQPWILHGFRGKPSVAQMFLRDGGIWFSFGEAFNPLTIHNIPSDRILAETDESPLPIHEIIHRLSDARGTDVTHFIAENTRRLLSLEEQTPE